MMAIGEKIWMEFNIRVLKRYPFRPAMAYWEANAIKMLIADRKPERCLEWGSGYSTVKFSKALPPSGTWTAIEHDEAWFERVKSLLGQRGDVTVHLVPPHQPKWEGDGDRDTFHDYIEATGIDTSGGYDLIIVDGRARSQYLGTAAKLLKPDGLCILHDANREAYWPSLEHFAFSCKLLSGRPGALGLAFASHQEIVPWRSLPMTLRLRRHYLYLEKIWQKLGG